MAMLRISICVAVISCVAPATNQTATAQPPAPEAEAPVEPTEAPEVLAPTPEGVRVVGAPCDTVSCDGCSRRCGHGDRNCRDRLRRWADHHWCDVCYCPLPFGSTVYGVRDMQIAKGDAAQMVLYDYDFENGGDELTCRGKLQVLKLARKLMETPYPVIIEAARCNEQLDAARRSTVLTYLEQTSMPVPAERVVVSAPPTRGLDGLDAEAVNDQIQGLWIQGGYRPLLQEHMIPRGFTTSNTGEGVSY